jgi:WD40 repeat protein
VRTLVFDVADGARVADVPAFAQEWAGPGRFFGDARGPFRLYDVRGGGLLLDLSGPRDEVKAAAWLGDAVASASRDGEELLWDLRPQRGLLFGHSGEIVAALTSGERLLTAGLDGEVRIWRWPEGREERLLRRESAATRGSLVAGRRRRAGRVPRR